MAFLTIDDAASKLFGEKLDFLRARSLPAFFFVEGRSIAGRETVLVKALKAGYGLGNHSFSHPRFSQLSLEECRSEIEKTDALLAALFREAGLSWTAKRFRFPYFDLGGGEDRAAALQDLLFQLGYRGPASQQGDWADTRCDFDQREYWLGKAEAPDGCGSREAILARIGPGKPADTDVILIHDHENTHELFFSCVEAYLARGLGFQPLD